MTVLGLLLSPVWWRCPRTRSGSCPTTTATKVRRVPVDLEGYRAKRPAARTHGPRPRQDPDFFAAALAAGDAGEMREPKPFERID